MPQAWLRARLQTCVGTVEWRCRIAPPNQRGRAPIVDALPRCNCRQSAPDELGVRLLSDDHDRRHLHDFARQPNDEISGHQHAVGEVDVFDVGAWSMPSGDPARVSTIVHVTPVSETLQSDNAPKETGVSSPAPPEIVSFAAQPFKVSSLAPPVIVSSPELPIAFALACNLHDWTAAETAAHAQPFCGTHDIPNTWPNASMRSH